MENVTEEASYDVDLELWKAFRYATQVTGMMGFSNTDLTDSKTLRFLLLCSGKNATEMETLQEEPKNTAQGSIGMNPMLFQFHLVIKFEFALFRNKIW